MFSASILMTYSVQVVLLVRFAERRNFPFSTSKAAKQVHMKELNEDKNKSKIPIEHDTKHNDPPSSSYKTVEMRIIA